MKTEPRLEIKYLVSTTQRSKLYALWSKHLIKAEHTDSYGCYPVLSQYFDSPLLQFYKDKYDGSPKRRKVRLRAYDSTFGAGPVFIEIKHRYGEKVWKTRKALGEEKHECLISPRVAGGIFATLADRYQLRPSARVYYTRQAFNAIDTVLGNVRVTFDTSVIGLFPEDRICEDILYDCHRYLIPEHTAILEVKADACLPAWFHEGIRKVGLSAKSISKYVLAVDKLSPTLLKLGENQ